MSGVELISVFATKKDTDLLFTVQMPAVLWGGSALVKQFIIGSALEISASHNVDDGWVIYAKPCFVN